MNHFTERTSYFALSSAWHQNFNSRNEGRSNVRLPRVVPYALYYFITFFSFKKLLHENNAFIKLFFSKRNTFFVYSKFSFDKMWYFLLRKVLFYEILYWKIVLFSILKLYDEMKYYILTIWFYNEKKYYKESIMFSKKVLKN